MENTEPIIEEINKITNNEYKFMLKSATLFESADFCVIEIFYKDGIILNKEIKDNIETKILELVPSCYKYEIKFVKNFISEERVFEDVKNYMEKHFNSISFLLDEVKRKDMVFEIRLTIDTLAFEHASQKNILSLIQKYLKDLYEDYDFSCELAKDVVFKKDELEILKENYKEEEVDLFRFRKIDYFDTVPLVGEEFTEQATYIVDKTVPEDVVVVCGKIKNIKSIVIKRKSKVETHESDNIEEKSDGIENEENDLNELKKEVALESQENFETDEYALKYERKLYKWMLEDFTGQIQCIFMSNKENQAKLEKLEAGSVIVVRGNSKKDEFSNSIVISVKDISYCSIPENLVEYIEWRKEKPFYEFVKPEPLIIYRQDDLMSFANEEIVPEYLRDKTFVTFDFETTGLHYDTGDRIVEVGAVKIVNGKITEKFVSLVNPDGKHIDAGASQVTGIYDEDVENAPKDYEVLQDFYKFTRGAILIGYNNINFDNVFLFGQAKKCRFNFDNQVEDVFRFAQKYVTGVKNYKLGTVAEKLGVVLDNAHSAVYDAIATAEVFIKIAEMIK